MHKKPSWRSAALLRAQEPWEAQPPRPVSQFWIPVGTLGFDFIGAGVLKIGGFSGACRNLMGCRGD